MPYNKQVFASRLYLAMTAAGMKQNDLAALSGISQGRISDYLNAKNTPRLDHAVALAEALKVSLTWLVGMESPPEEPAVQEMLLTIWQNLPEEKRRTILSFLRMLAGGPIKDVRDQP